MELIQNWSSQDKTKLLDRILEVLGDKEYIDIVVYGSRVSGDFNVKSDIDVGVYVNEIKRCPCCQLQPAEITSYVNGIYHPENELGNWFVMDITFHLATKIKSNNWKQFDEIYDLPKYSLITNEYYPGNIKETKEFKKIKLKQQ
jgi:predicted nucleotidyltransferase